ncbi:hypothetical protein GCM10020331_100210 [Ectobacillus funiculus]
MPLLFLGKGISLYTGDDITLNYTLTKVEKKLGQLAMLHYIKKIIFHHLSLFLVGEDFFLFNYIFVLKHMR